MAGRIPEHVIQDIKDRVSILEVVGDYVRLQKDGANYKGLCPFHQEKTPSFKVHEGKGIYKCFGCGESGNVFKFLMKLEGMSFMEAAEKLASRAGITIPREELKPEDLKREQDQGRIFRANQAAAEFYHQTLLKAPEAKIARDYLDQRGYGAETVDRYQLGYSPASWDATISALKSQGIAEADVHAAGLALSRDSGGYYDRFRGRLMFPIHDVQGRVRGFGARQLGEDKDQPKYINTPETVIFKKGQGFYGLYQAKEEIRKTGRALVVEGYFDQIALDHAGVKYAVATLGTALTADHARLLRRYSRDVFLVFDADEAGQKAAIRSIEPFLEAGLSPRIILIPEGKDPDEYLRAHSAAEFRKLLQTAPPLVAHHLDQLIAAAEGTPAGLSKAVWEAAEILSRVRDPIERGAFTERIARRTGIPLPQVQARLRRPEKRDETGQSAAAPGDPTWTDFIRPELDLIRLLILHPETMGLVRDSGVAAKFRDPEMKKLAQDLLDQDRETGRTDPATLIENISDPALSDSVTRVIFDKDPFGEKAMQVAPEIIGRVLQGGIEARLLRLRREIEDAQEKGDEGKWRKLLEEQKTLMLEKREISAGRAG
jgi:DNA primase